MELQTIAIVGFIISGLEIFFSIFSKIFTYILSSFKDDFVINSKIDETIKAILAGVFFISAMYIIYSLVFIVGGKLNIF